MTAPSLYRHATRSEIIDLAVVEGHDADISTSAGSIRPVASRTSTRPSKTADEDNELYATMEKDVEKGEDHISLSSADNSAAAELDPNIVDFDGPDDPENPLNWSYNKKWGMVSLVSAITFLTPLASSIFAPGVPQVMTEFNSTNDMLAGFMISVYVLGVSSFGAVTDVVLTPSVCLRTFNYCTSIGDVRQTAIISQLQLLVRCFHDRGSRCNQHGAVHYIPLLHGMLWRSSDGPWWRDHC